MRVFIKCVRRRTNVQQKGNRASEIVYMYTHGGNVHHPLSHTHAHHHGAHTHVPRQEGGGAASAAVPLWRTHTFHTKDQPHDDDTTARAQHPNVFLCCSPLARVVPCSFSLSFLVQQAHSVPKHNRPCVYIHHTFSHSIISIETRKNVPTHPIMWLTFSQIRSLSLSR
jgi:hypothetical protein